MPKKKRGATINVLNVDATDPDKLFNIQLFGIQGMGVGTFAAVNDWISKPKAYSITGTKRRRDSNKAFRIWPLYFHSRKLQKIGIEKAQREGKFKGRVPTAKRKTQEIQSLIAEGLKPQQIANQCP